jgi:hypothetical protein
MRSSLRLVTIAVLFAWSAGCSGSRSDASITTDVQAKLFSSAQAKSATLEVATSNGVVTLSGEVPSDAARYEAFKLAADTPGVTRVNDQMTVAQAQPVAAPVPEAAPTPAVAPRPARSPVQQRAPRREVAAAPQPAPPAPTPVATTMPPEPPVHVMPTPPPPPPAPVMRTVEIPAGTELRAQTRDSVDSSVNRAGEMFHASLAAPIVVDNEVIVPAGADVILRLVDASSAGRMTGRSGLTLQLASLEFQGQSYDLYSSDYQQTGASEGRRTAATVGGGAAVGAIIGGIVGGGKGAAIGAGAGAGAGTVASAATRAQQVQIPAETTLNFTLQQPVTVTYNPEKNRTAR